VNLDDRDVQEIVRLLDDSRYDELTLETERFRLVLRRGEGAGGWTQERETRGGPHLQEPVATKAHTPGTPAAGQAVPGPAGEPPPDDGLVEVPAPMVGTFYRAPQPGAKPFVEVGSKVEPDTVIAIIEVMKLMNSVPAGVRGTVREICVENAGFVERGRCLMRVEPET